MKTINVIDAVLRKGAARVAPVWEDAMVLMPGSTNIRKGKFSNVAGGEFLVRVGRIKYAVKEYTETIKN